MSHLEPSHESDKAPVQRIEWKGSVAEVHNPDALLEECKESTLVVYDRADLQTPIERVSVTMENIDLDGETGTAMTGIIQLDRSRDDYIGKGDSSLQSHQGILSSTIVSRAALSTDSIFVPFNKKDADLLIEPTVFSNVFKVSHTNGIKTLVWIDSNRKIITVSNNLTLSVAGSENNRKVEIRPPVDGTIDSSSIYEGFFKSLMRTIDFTAGLDTFTPTSKRLNRQYIVGREIKHPDSKPTRRIGSSAVTGATLPTEPNNPETQTSTETTAIPELEIIDSKLSLDDVGGLEQVKATLRDIALSFKHPEIMEKWGALRPQGVLMYGEPGTGKTMLAEALASEIEAELWKIQSSDIYNKWLGESDRHIKEIFERARNHQGKLVLFFDEFDSIVGISDNGNGVRDSVAGIFKQEMNTLAKENPNVIVIAATNDLDKIDPSLIRSGRFDYKVYVPMPDASARQEILINIVSRSMLSQETEDFKMFDDDLDTASLASSTDGMSGADITEIFRRIGLARAMQEARTNETPAPITQAELEQEITSFRRRG